MEPEIAVLIAGIGGATLGILGQLLGNYIQHKNKINYMEKQFLFKRKIESYETILKSLNEERYILNRLKNKDKISQKEFSELEKAFEKYKEIQEKVDIWTKEKIKHNFHDYLNWQDLLTKINQDKKDLINKLLLTNGKRYSELRDMIKKDLGIKIEKIEQLIVEN